MSLRPNLVDDALCFAQEAHQTQLRKYTFAPYFTHLEEVAKTVSIYRGDPVTQAVAYLHDCMEDQDVSFDTLVSRFGAEVAFGVMWLTDTETGNREARKSAARKRLSLAPAWVQDIKCADLYSNARSIFEHDPKFASVFVAECLMLLDVMTRADARLVELVHSVIDPYLLAVSEQLVNK